MRFVRLAAPTVVLFVGPTVPAPSVSSFVRPAAPTVVLSPGCTARLRRVQCRGAYASRAYPERWAGAGAAVQSPGRLRARAR